MDEGNGLFSKLQVWITRYPTLINAEFRRSIEN